jgi:hypothetical protein
MKAITKTQITDSDENLIVLVFENDEERIRIGNQILNNFEPKEGKRAYAIYPDDKITGEYVIKFVTPFI